MEWWLGLCQGNLTPVMGSMRRNSLKVVSFMDVYMRWYSSCSASSVFFTCATNFFAKDAYIHNIASESRSNNAAEYFDLCTNEKYKMKSALTSPMSTAATSLTLCI